MTSVVLHTGLRVVVVWTHNIKSNNSTTRWHSRISICTVAFAMKFFTNTTFMLLMIAASSSDVVVTGKLLVGRRRPGPGPGPNVPPPTECQSNCQATLDNCVASHDAPPFNLDTSCWDEFFNCIRSCHSREEGVAGLRGGHFINRVVAEDALE
jgi:hypothetical protein